jgi:hypothetical protein
MFHFDGGPQAPREIEDLTKELLGPAKAEEFWRQWRANYITEADIDQIAKMGFNSVRVPLHWKFFMSEDTEGFKLLDQVVEWARKDGIYVILDLHCAPGGQTGSNIDDSWGYPWLYTSPEAQDETVAIWKRIAARYKNNSTVLGYDLLNEPLPNWEKLRLLKRELVPVYMKIAAGIRQVDKNHVLILGGANWDSDFGVFSGAFDPNTMFTLHKYWTATTDKSVIQPYLDFRHEHHVPIWLGESGENKDAWVEGFRKTLEENNVGWAFWTGALGRDSGVCKIAGGDGRCGEAVGGAACAGGYRCGVCGFTREDSVCRGESESGVCFGAGVETVRELGAGSR